LERTQNQREKRRGRGYRDAIKTLRREEASAPVREPILKGREGKKKEGFEMAPECLKKGVVLTRIEPETQFPGTRVRVRS